MVVIEGNEERLDNVATAIDECQVCSSGAVAEAARCGLSELMSWSLCGDRES